MVRRPLEKPEPRLPAIVLWTLTGAFTGLALGIFAGHVVLLAVGGALGLAWGLFSTRPAAMRKSDERRNSEQIDDR